MSLKELFNMVEKNLGMGGYANRLIENIALLNAGDKIVKAFSRPREIGYAEVKRLNLPHLDTYTGSADELLKKFSELVPQDRNHMWYVGLDPKKSVKDKGKIRIHSIQTDKILDAIEERLKKDGLDASDYMLTIAETYPHEYGGNIVVNKYGDVYAEFVNGNTSIISQGKSKSKDIYRVTTDPYMNSFKYYKSEKDVVLNDDDEHDMEIKKAFWKTMQCIPHEGANRDIKFEPGYYEFALIRKAKGDDLEPIFIDYSADEVFSE